jgi:hypothetical protein
MILTVEKRSVRRKTCPTAILSTTNPTWTAWDRTLVSAVRGRRPSAWTMAQRLVLLGVFTSDIQLPYEIRFVFLPMCTVATAVRATCKDGGSVPGVTELWLNCDWTVTRPPKLSHCASAPVVPEPSNGLDHPGLDARYEQGNFLFLKSTRQVRSPPSVLFNAYQRFFQRLKWPELEAVS